MNWEISIQYKKNENFTTVRRWMSVQLLLQKGDTYSHTHQHTQHICSDVHSVLPSLSLYPHTRTHQRNCQHLHSGKRYLNSSKTLGWKLTWSVTCYWTVSSLIGACLNPSNCWFMYKLKLTIAKCLLSPLHARTQPAPATRAQGQSMEQPSSLNISPIPVWHITITMKQYAIC